MYCDQRTSNHMGLFSSIFRNRDSGEKPEDSDVSWILLNRAEQLDEIEVLSKERPQFIFKHSTSCGISGMVLRMFKKSYNLDAQEADLYYLDLHSYRQLSNEVARKFGVHHQSPQLIVIKNGEVVDHNSHGAISGVPLEKYL